MKPRSSKPQDRTRAGTGLASGPLLVGLAHERRADPAIRRAGQLAPMLRRRLVFVHVVDDRSLLRAHADDLARHVQADAGDRLESLLPESVDWQLRVLTGRRARVLLRHERPHLGILESAEGHDLILMGTHGRGAFSAAVLGSTAHEVLGDGSCPTVAVRHARRPAHRPRRRGRPDGPGAGRDFIPGKEHIMTNTQRLTGQWNELKGKIQQRWSKLTDQDLAKVGDKVDELSDMIAARYQLGKEEARRQLDDFTEKLKSGNG